METSYETICAADLSAPKKGYCELLDHPAIITPYTPKEDTANKYITPTLISEITQPGANGITAQPTRLKTNVIIGANMKTILFESLCKIEIFYKYYNYCTPKK